MGAQGGAQGAAGTTGLDRAEQRMSIEGSANQNAQGRAGATRGIDRARERVNQNALDRARGLEAEGEAAAAARARGALR